MSVYFEVPEHIALDEAAFAEREVGLVHPDNDSYIRVNDNGDIHIMASPDLGIVISKSKRAIILVGDIVKFATREDSGLVWNTKSFNANAIDFSESTFVEYSPQNPFEGIERYLA